MNTKTEGSDGKYRIVFPQNDKSCLTVKFIRPSKLIKVESPFWFNAPEFVQREYTEEELVTTYFIASRKVFDTWEEAISYGRELSGKHHLLFKVGPNRGGYLD